MMIGAIKLYLLISVWMTLTFIQGHSCMKIENFSDHFLRNFTVDLDKIQYVATIC